MGMLTPSRKFRRLLPWLALLPMLSACQSPPGPHSSVSETSSVLAVDVRFPSPLGRDHSLVQAFFVKGREDTGAGALPELIPATFVKNSRAYLLDPEPGNYELVAVASKVSPARRRHPVAGGVNGAVSKDPLGHVVAFPAEWIGRTKTMTRPGSVAFMGAAEVRRADRINAGAVMQDELQKEVAERIRPGVTSESGLAGMLSTTWMPDESESAFGNTAADRKAFFEEAPTELDESPWASAIARAAPARARTAARARPTAPTPETPPPATPKTSSPAPPETTPNRAVAPQVPQAEAPLSSSGTNAALPSPWIPEPELEPAPIPQPDAEPEPIRQPDAELEPELIAGIPPDSPLAQIEVGMHHGTVRGILGEPDEKIDRVSKKTAWIPFYSGPDARLIEWVYVGMGRVVFSMHTGKLRVYDAVAEQEK